MSKKTLIMVTNDDGIYGPGLDPLRQSLASLGDVITIVPDHERSTVSHSLTLHKPLRLRQIKRGLYFLNGTPADCVRFSVLHLLRGRKVDIVVSGINNGVNLGEDVIYSGTVAGAIEGTMLNLPSIAISQSPSVRPQDFKISAKFARKLVRHVLRKGLAKGICLNVNVPVVSSNGTGSQPQGVRFTRLGHRLYGNKITIRRDPRGNYYYWLLAKNVLGVSLPESDVEALRQGYISVTPLRLDWTATDQLKEMRKWKF